MDHILLDTALHLPSIDPTPARMPGRGDAGAFDGHLQRASSPAHEQREQNKPPGDKKATDKPSMSASANSDQTIADTRNDSPGDDGQDEAISTDITASTSEDQPVAVAEPTDAESPEEEADIVDADAAVAAAQMAVAVKPTQPVQTDAPQPLPAHCDVLEDTGKPPGELSNAGQNADVPQDEVNPTSGDTPDVNAEQLSELPAVVKPHELHAAARAQVKPTSPTPQPAAEVATDDAQTPPGDATPPEAVAPVAKEPPGGDKKTHTKLRADDLKRDTNVNSDTTPQTQAVVAADELASSPLIAAATDTSSTVPDGTSVDGSGKSNSLTAQTQITSTSAQQNNAAQASNTPGPTAAQKLLDGGTRAATRGDNASEVDRARFVQRVSKAFQTASQRGEPLRLRLSPPELGAVRMEVSIRAGAMTARLQAETPAAQSMLLDNLPALRERLAQHDIKIERFDVDLLGQQQDGSQQSQTDASDRQLARAQHNNLLRTRSGNVASESTVTTRRRTSTGGAGQLDVVI